MREELSGRTTSAANVNLTWPKHLYKFLRFEDAHFILKSETLILSTPARFAREYREMEFPDPTINDPRDGMTGLHQNREFNYGDASANEKNAVRALIGDAASISDETVFEGNSIVNPTGEMQSHGLLLNFSGANLVGGRISQNIVAYAQERVSILSLTLEDTATVKNVFNDVVSKGGPKYDCCIRFDFIQTFVESLVTNALLLDEGPSPWPIAPRHRRWGIGPVVYTKTERVWTEQLAAAGPLTKDINFKDQKEARLILFGSQLPDKAKIWMPGLRNFVGKVTKF